MRLSETAKSSVSLAFSLGLIGAIVVFAWYYVVVPYRKTPARPTFANDFKEIPAPKSPITALKTVPLPKPTIAAKPKSNDAKYKGTVNASIGLVFRAAPSQSSGNVGGADYKTKVAVIKETPDREWLFVRNESTKEEGWVRSGNISKE